MKKILHRVLSMALAACLLLGAATYAAAANKSFGASVTVRKMPNDPTFIPDLTWPDLTGLELNFKLGNVTKVLRYDEMGDWLDKIDWSSVDLETLDMEQLAGENEDFGIWLIAPKHDQRIGKNKFTLTVSVAIENESYIKSSIPITLTGVSVLDKADMSNVKALKAGLPNRVVPKPAYDDIQLFSFTPKASGLYNFRSSFSERPRLPALSELPMAFTLYQLLGAKEVLSYLFTRVADPVCALFDAKGELLATSDDREGFITSFDFKLSVQLTAGETYYLLPACFDEEIPYFVTPSYLV